MTTYYLGLSVSGHDPAFAVVDAEGRLVFAEATERFVQDKRAWGIAPDHYDHVAGALSRVCPDMTRLVAATSWARPKPESEAVPPAASGSADGLIDPLTARWLREHQRRSFSFAGQNLPMVARGVPLELRHYDHHLCHAVYSCASSPFDAAHCVVIDGEGEVGAVSLYAMKGRRLTRSWRSWGPGSLGALYAFLTLKCGFEWRLGEEWKVMGLAAFGTALPEITDPLSRLITLDRGRPRAAAPAVWDEVCAAIAPFVRGAGEDVMRAADLAAGGQAVYAALADGILASAGLKPGDYLVLGGGCALNSSYNGTVRQRFGLGGMHVPPAPADDGNAAGAALLAWLEETGAALPRGWDSPYLGNEPNLRSLAAVLARGGLGRTTELGAGDTAAVAALLTEGKILGVMRGRAEFGPRALGHRSILADPRPAEMKERINRRVKGREPYRPFAPIVSERDAADWFDAPDPSPYMSFTKTWRRGRAEQVPAVVHADGTGRLQTVAPGAEPWLSSLLADFGRETGVPVVLNTSLNVMGKPIANSVEDAITIFATTGLDALLVGDVLIQKPAG
ncbi:MAG TPA: carbamoyltransferase C-terminal domain-containing protein [Allosphingosinicella sp.]|nr:carbamoyltransferase C-terminal domain-containing protein [Allosphingosinicella sp.]